MEEHKSMPFKRICKPIRNIIVNAIDYFDEDICTIRIKETKVYVSSYDFKDKIIDINESILASIKELYSVIRSYNSNCNEIDIYIDDIEDCKVFFKGNVLKVNNFNI